MALASRSSFKRRPVENTVRDLPGEATTHIKTITMIDNGGGVLVNQARQAVLEVRERVPQNHGVRPDRAEYGSLVGRRTIAPFLGNG
jgi:hypothetical protein